MFIKKLLRESITRPTAVGVLIKCDKTDKIFLMLRNDKRPTWSLVSGGLENGEEPIDCLKREVSEELSIDPNIINYKKVGVEDIPSKNLTFHYYEGLTSNEFIPKLDHENLEWGWFEKDNLPSPLYTGMEQKIKNFELNDESLNESDPKVGTGKKPKGSGRRLYTDENPNDTVSVKFRTKEDIVDTLNKESFKSKPHKRQSQIINLIHQRVRAAYQNAKDPETKSRLKRAYDYIENVKEKSKEKTISLQKK